MIRALLLILPLAAATCGPNPDPSPTSDEIPGLMVEDEEFPELMTDDDELPELMTGDDELPELMTDDDEGFPELMTDDDPATRYARSPALGVWQLTRIGGESPMSAATITWSFRADGTGTYEQDIVSFGPLSMDAADGGREFRWQPAGGGAYIASDGARFVPHGQGQMIWRSAGMGGEDYVVSRW